MDDNDAAGLEKNLEQLERDGFLLVPGALDREIVQQWRDCLYGRYERKEYDGRNGVGNVYFNELLAQEPELARELIAHPSVAPLLKALLGRQCQLRSMRAHVNPDDYTQEWHMDFRDYWYQDEKAGGKHVNRAFCVNTTFYPTDNTPERGRLSFIKDCCHRPIPPHLVPDFHYSEDRENPFQSWCYEQPRADLHPMSGDAVIFLSHLPYQGAKIGPDEEGEIRANIVLHYQQNPMFPGILFVSHPQSTLETLGYDGSFPFREE